MLQLFNTLIYKVRNIGVCSDKTNINTDHFHTSPRDIAEILAMIKVIQTQIDHSLRVIQVESSFEVESDVNQLGKQLLNINRMASEALGE